MWWFQEGLCALPAFLVVCSTATFMLPYVMAVILRHVDPWLPYISDSGTQPPERCLFGIMLNISTFLGIATMYVRYKQVQVLMREEHRVHCLNALGLALGFGSCLGMCVVANFQKSTLISVHLLGAAMTFGLGMLYILVESAVSYHMQPHVHSKRVFLVRLAMGLWSLASIIIMSVSAAINYSSLPAVDVIMKSHWVPGMPAYTAHLVSTIAEWSVAFSFVTFFLTYIRDFQKITLRAEAELQSNHLYDSTRYNASSRLHHREESPLLAGNISARVPVLEGGLPQHHLNNTVSHDVMSKFSHQTRLLFNH